LGLVSRALSPNLGDEMRLTSMTNQLQSTVDLKEHMQQKESDPLH